MTQLMYYDSAVDNAPKSHSRGLGSNPEEASSDVLLFIIICIVSLELFSLC